MAGLRKAVNKAGLRLMYVERYEDRTVYHDFFTQYGKTKIIVRQQPPGHGVSIALISKLKPFLLASLKRARDC